MIATYDYNIDEATIAKTGLRLSENNSNTPVVLNTRVFEFPHLQDVFVMESDLYGNPMPKGLCSLAFYGNHGFIGTPIKVEHLKNASEADIENLVKRHVQG